jgi:putative DNA methylase
VNQAFNTMSTYCTKSAFDLNEVAIIDAPRVPIEPPNYLYPIDARAAPISASIYVTDPPYADAIRYEEITEFFIAWLRKNPPPPFDQWTWDLAARSRN